MNPHLSSFVFSCTCVHAHWSSLDLFCETEYVYTHIAFKDRFWCPIQMTAMDSPMKRRTCTRALCRQQRTNNQTPFSFIGRYEFERLSVPDVDASYHTIAAHMQPSDPEFLNHTMRSQGCRQRVDANQVTKLLMDLYSISPTGLVVAEN